MGITGESLFRDFKSFTSADTVGTYYQITNAGGGQGRSVTTFNIINNDTIDHNLDVVLETYDGASWVVAESRTFKILAGDSILATEFLVPLLPRVDTNHDRIRTKINEAVGSGKNVQVFIAGAQFV
ncbi:hypothetical protein [Desulforegula conservatrix]|uniref:hypothetical protein n=1 Tax=Desulforegula conservatrix TaxID=153026 RepID=UPI000422F27E|nr:hypothetical protein [Desulforegula conservatrix]